MHQRRYKAYDNQKWLTLLSKDLDKADAQRVVTQMELLTEENERRHGDSVLQVAMQENEGIFSEVSEIRVLASSAETFFSQKQQETKSKTTKNQINTKDLHLRNKGETNKNQ